MAKVSKSKAFDIPANEMWERVGDFHRLQSWTPGIEHEERIDGNRRRITFGAANHMVERLIKEGNRQYTYAIDEGPLPVTNYVSTLRVREAGPKACFVEWELEFDPVGIPEAQAVAIVEAIYDAGLNGLAAR
jgi:hypothetical protein